MYACVCDGPAAARAVLIYFYLVPSFHYQTVYVCAMCIMLAIESSSIASWCADAVL